MGDSYSYIGAVVGATYPKMGEVLRKIMPKSYILVPGYGAQGGQAKDLAPFFNEDGLGAIINSSRGSSVHINRMLTVSLEKKITQMHQDRLFSI